MQTPGLSEPLQMWVRSRCQPRPQVAGKGDPKTQARPADAPEEGVWGREAAVPSGGRVGEVAPGYTCVCPSQKGKRNLLPRRGVSVCLDLITALHLPGRLLQPIIVSESPPSGAVSSLLQIPWPSRVWPPPGRPPGPWQVQARSPYAAFSYALLLSAQWQR